jgi:hypothetical protein
MSIYEVHIKSLRPLLMHSGALCDPTSAAAKAIKAASKQTQKSDADYEELSRLEFMGSLYWDKKLGIYMPWENLAGCLERGAAKRRLGKVFKACVSIDTIEAGFSLEYKGPKDPDALWADEKFRLTKGARVKNARVMRTRPRFPEWSLTFPIEVMNDGVTKDQLISALRDGGLYEGLGDWRPRYGRFDVESVKTVRRAS